MLENTSGGVFVALDFPDLPRAISFTQKLSPEHKLYKVGLELFTAHGPEAIKALKKAGKTVFLDLKLHDIPNTVAGACRSVMRLGASFLTIHGEGGLEMIKAAVDAVQECGAKENLPPLKILAVTRLTSLPSSTDQIIELALTAQKGGADGVIASPLEAKEIKLACGRSFLTVCPGIRMPEGEAGDQKRISDPFSAARAGADYIVVGRPITQADSPSESLAQINKEFWRGKQPF